MKQISIENATNGMILARPIYDDKNRMLMQQGSKLSDVVLNKLKEIGFLNICIETKETQGIILNDVVSTDVKNKAANAVRDLDIVTVVDCAKEIVDSIYLNNTAFDLIDTRNKKDYEYYHAVSVAEMAVVVGKYAVDENGRRFSRENLIELATAALLHDVGRRCSDKRVLEQLGLSSDKIQYTEELAPVFSYNLLKDNSFVSSKSRAAILFHKTDENGNNCPLKNMDKSKIHVFAKILHIVSDYDMLITNNKKNGERVTSTEAIGYMISQCGKKYNYELLDAFVNNVPIYPKGTSLELSDGSVAIVYDNTIGKMARPKVILEDGTKIDLSECLDIKIVGEIRNYEKISVKSK